MTIKSILVVELLGGFGDLLMVLPAVHALARSHPDAAVTVLTFRPGDDLLTEDPYVTHVLATDDHTEGVPRRAVAAELARIPYDLVVTTTTYDGIARLCAETAPASVTDLWRGPPAEERVDRRFLRLLADDGVIAPEYADLPVRVHLTDSERAEARRELDTWLTGNTGPPLVLVPAAGMGVKRWRAERWRDLAAQARRRGRAVVSVGPPDGLVVEGADPLPSGNLRRLAAQLAVLGEHGAVVVGGDTGPVRLATAVGAHAVGLFGPTVASRYGADPALSTSLQGLPGCEVRRPTAISEQECWWAARCPLSADGPACMDDISVSAVLAAVSTPIPQS